jgi:hypothetical protein
MDSSTLDKLEDTEVAIEELLADSTTDQLSDLAAGMKVPGLEQGLKKTKLLKLIRGFIERSLDEKESDDDKLLLLTFILEGLKTVRGGQRKTSKNPIEADREIQVGVTEEPQMQSPPQGLKSDGRQPASASSVSELASILHNLASGDTEGNLLRRPLKIVGWIAADAKDQKSSIGYLNLVSQVEDAKARNYSDDDIARAVRRAIAPSSYLRTYFDTQPSVGLADILAMIRDYQHEKSASELFHDLGKLSQRPQESATDFLVRAFELRQKASAAARVEGNLYDPNLICETFCRSLRTGLSNAHIRTHMRPFLLGPTAKGPNNRPSSDQDLLREINIASSESEETSVKQKATTAKKVTVNEASAGTKSPSTAQDVASAIKPLLEGMAALQKQVTDLQQEAKQKEVTRPRTSYANGTTNRPVYKCRSCREKNWDRCVHCFNCGSDSHQVRHCTANPKN